MLVDTARLQDAALAAIMPVTVWVVVIAGVWAALVRPLKREYLNLARRAEEALGFLIIAGFSGLIVVLYAQSPS